MGKQVYEKPIRLLLKDFAEELREGEKFNTADVLKWFERNYPKVLQTTLRSFVILCTTNNPTRVHYNAKSADDLFFREDTGKIRKFDPLRDPAPIYFSNAHEKTSKRRSRRNKPDIGKRINDLVNNFDKYLDYFNTNIKFSGPSIYFHKKVIDKIRNTINYAAIFNDDIFFEYLYAVLVSWGMHQMGDKTAKMAEFEVFKKSILDNKTRFKKLSNARLERINGKQA